MRWDLESTDRPTVVFLHHSLAEQELAGNYWFDIYMLNPFAILMTAYRECVFYGNVVSANTWAMLTVEAVVILAGGTGLYRYFETSKMLLRQ